MEILGVTLWTELEQYCKLNGMKTTEEFNKFLNECITIGFNIKKYGTGPQIQKPSVRVEGDKMIIQPTEGVQKINVDLVLTPDGAKFNNKEKDDYDIYDN